MKPSAYDYDLAALNLRYAAMWRGESAYGDGPLVSLARECEWMACEIRWPEAVRALRANLPPIPQPEKE